MPPASKRKADEGASSKSRKRSKTKADFAAAKELVDEILEGNEEDGVGASDAKLLAEYIRALEDEIAAGSGQPKGKSSSQIKDAATKLRAACVSGIKKQMSWKPSCKTGCAKCSYDGVCIFSFSLLLICSCTPASLSYDLVYRMPTIYR
ncbi:hypothetical protein C8F01DRAFT_1232021, partial [Mycena amicta]